MSDQLTSPPGKRIIGFDVARCLAILAMVYVNYEVVLAKDDATPAWLRSLADAFEGRAAALFVTLAGIGITLLDDRRILVRRAFFLLLAGYAWQLLWPGDILHFYGAYLLLGALFLRRSPLLLLFLAFLSILVFLGLFYSFAYGTGWDFATLSCIDFWTVKGQIRNLFFNGWHPVFPWIAFLFWGMALGRFDLSRSGRRRVVLLLAILIAAAAEIASRFLSQIEDTRPILEQLGKWYEGPELLFGTGSIPPMPLYVLSAGATAVAVICLVLELTAHRSAVRWAAPLVSCGQLALTFYLGHILIGLADSEDFADAPDLETAAFRALLFCGGAVLFAWLWRKRFRRGPLEWAMRHLCG
jgi:uncharacterized protein